MIGSMITKDLKRMFRDRKGLLITLLMPTVLIAILGFSVGQMFSGDYDLEPAEVAIVNEDNVAADKERLIQFLNSSFAVAGMDQKQKEAMIRGIGSFRPDLILTDEVLKSKEISSWVKAETLDREKAIRLLKEGKKSSVIVIPEGFAYHYWVSTLLPVTSSSKIEVWRNTDQEIRGGIVESIVKSYTDVLSAGLLAKNVFQEVAVEENKGIAAYGEIGPLMTSLGEKGAGMKVTYNDLPIEGKRSISGLQYYAIAMSAMFILFAAAYGAEYSIQEKQFHTYERILLSGQGRFPLYMGRFFSTALFSLIQMIFLILVSRFLFGVDWGDTLTLIPLLLLVALGIGALSVLLSAINFWMGNEKGSDIFSMFITQIFAVAGGSFIPSFMLPEPIRLIGDYTINGAALKGFMKVMQGYGMVDMIPIMVNLSVMILLFIGAAYLIGRRKVV